ncbi:mitochondrial protein pet191 homolog isoform X4 [Mangifera indica]|uniref:mitochondrial protein pet191 homolog isoform X4 n=1 Tax=Mangifera indica TaxID=29780 RepID=UPI001CFA803C|nr:mitochondrial protein pet191 homolog isoform X4 [Mangifera indica]
MSKSCKGLAMELVKCLSESDCIKVEKRSYRECAGEKSPSISSECVGLRETYFNCKRGQASSFSTSIFRFFNVSFLCFPIVP